MKKILSVLSLIVFTGSVLAATTPTSSSASSIGNFLNKVSAAENEVTSKIEANQKAREAKKQEIQQKQDANKKAIEQAKKDADARHQATKNAVQNEINYWKNLK